jgi:hypothetical protein
MDTQLTIMETHDFATRDLNQIFKIKNLIYQLVYVILDNSKNQYTQCTKKCIYI